MEENGLIRQGAKIIHKPSAPCKNGHSVESGTCNKKVRNMRCQTISFEEPQILHGAILTIALNVSGKMGGRFMIKKCGFPMVIGCLLLCALNSAAMESEPAPVSTTAPTIATAPTPTTTPITAPTPTIATAPTPTTATTKCYIELESAVYALESATDADYYSSATHTILELIPGCHKRADIRKPQEMMEYFSFLQSLDTTISSIRTLLTNTTIYPDQPAQEKKVKELQKVQQALLIEQKTVDNRGAGWDKDYEANFHLGFEGTTVSGVTKKNTTRTGLTVYSQLLGPQQCGNDCKLGRVTWFPGFKPVLFGDIMLSSSVSSSNTVTTNGDPSLSSSNTGSVSPSVGVNLNLFVPIITQNHSFGLIAIGPIGSFQFDKPDDSKQFTTGFFYGFRFANSPFTYFDVMYGSVGRIQGISGGRLSFRGQYLVGDALSGHIFVGGSANMSSHVLESNPPDKTEWFKIYVMWQVALSDIFTKK